MAADRKWRILHIAPQNMADVPMKLVRAERRLGHTSRLMTFFRDPRGYPEDICLNLPLVTDRWTRRVKRRITAPERLMVDNRRRPALQKPPVWRPHNVIEHWLVRCREMLWTPRLRRAMDRIDFWNFDVYEFDGGLDFYRDGRTVRRLKALGKTVIVAYTGSDLRTRGIIEAVDRLADVRVTFEWDHLELHPDVHHVLFPFEPWRFAFRLRDAGPSVRIGHAPTQRRAKGTEAILQALRHLERERTVDIVLIENLPYSEALKLKETCDIFIDQLGELGYGLNALEALALGIPTCTSLVPAFVKAHPDHPFVEVREDDLKDTLLQLIDRPQWRRELARKGREWVERAHDSRRVVQTIHELAGLTSVQVSGE